MDDTPRHTVIVEGQFNDDNLTHQSYRKIGRRKRWNNRGLYKSFILIFNIYLFQFRYITFLSSIKNVWN
jgi:hypothetical protein